MSLQDLYRTMVAGPSDIQAHLPTLYSLAQQCKSATEFGVATGRSTVALLAGLEAGGGGHLTSYDCDPCVEARRLITPDAPAHRWTFVQADVLAIPPIAPTDLLFIDTRHTAVQVYGELRLHAASVRTYLAFHDTLTYGETDVVDGIVVPGLLYGIGRYLLDHGAHGAEWRLFHDSRADHGFRVYKRVG